MKFGRERRRHGRFDRWLHATILTLLVVIGATWVVAIRDHPVSESVVAGLNTPGCAALATAQPGSGTAAMQSRSPACEAYLDYRAAHPGMAGDQQGYAAALMQSRVAEFWRLIGYVLVFWAIAMVVAIGIALAVRRLAGRHVPRH